MRAVFSTMILTGFLAVTTATASLAAINTAPTFVVGDGIVTTDINGSSYSVVVQPDGRIVVAGTSINDGHQGFALVRYNPDGSLDTTFDGDGIVTTAIGPDIDIGRSVAVQADGKILVAGTSAFNGFALVRYNPDGRLDATFSGGGIVTTAIGRNAGAESVAVQPDGKIVVVGNNTDGFNQGFILVRYTSNGCVDTTFDGDGIVTTAIDANAGAKSVAVQPDGQFLVAGYSSNESNSDFAMVRYNPDGSLDTAFDGDGIVTTSIGTIAGAESVAVQADGKILLAGNSSLGGFTLVCYNSDGSLDTTFSGDGIVTTGIGSGAIAHSVAVQADGKIVVAGESRNGSTPHDFALVRYNTDGSLDTTFDGDGIVTTAISTSYDYGYSVAVQADNKIVVAGGSNNNFALARYSSDGSLDRSFSLPENTLDAVPSYTEGYPPVVLDSNVAILDSELSAAGNYAGATLTLERHQGANAEDIFSAKSGGTLTALSEGAYFGVDSVTIGRVNSSCYGTLALEFNANATQTLVNKAIQQIAYWNTSNAPPPSVQIDWTFDDGNTGDQGDGGAMSVTGSTAVNIHPLNDSPGLVHYLANQVATVNVAFSYTLPADAFTDPDGEVLSYSIAMANGTAVSPWLSFNAGTRTLSGTPGAGDLGSFEIRVAAQDAAGATAWDVFRLTVTTLDVDGDGFKDSADNCPSIANASQSDANGNGLGDACDTGSDTDGDGLTDAQEYGLGTNPANPDTDGDGLPDGSDPNPLVAPALDTDGDGFKDSADNCPSIPNPSQSDANGNGLGDACDTGSDTDRDGLTDAREYELGTNPANPDTDGDGLPDGIDPTPRVFHPVFQVGAYRPATGQWFLDLDGNGLWGGCTNSGGLDFCGQQFGAPSDTPMVGDWTGDGQFKPGAYRPATGQWFFDLNGNGLWDGCGIDFCGQQFGSPTDTPVVGDWTGDGRFKPGAYRPATGQWFFDLNGNGLWDGCGVDFCGQQFGAPSDTPMVGDWDGNGRYEPGAYRPATGQWFLDMNGNGLWDGCGIDFCGQQFGSPTDIPKVGDWNGDGRFEVGTYRPATGQWFLDLDGNGLWGGCTSSGGLDFCGQQFGAPTDIPVVGAWRALASPAGN